MDGHSDTMESVHTLLMEVDLPASFENIKNPTEDFMINIISQFFKSFFIDVATIRRMTLDQLKALDVTGEANAPIAHLLNLREAMGVIGREIFIKEFHITDITSPRQLRTKKHLKFIANFMLYARNKKAHMQERINEVLGRAELLQNLRKQKEEIRERMNKKVRETSDKKLEIEKLKKDIKEREARIAKNKKFIQQKEPLIDEKQQLKARKVARNQEKRTELQKRQETADLLNEKVVKSPEKIRAQLTDLKEIKKNQEEKRENVQISILHKKTMLHNLEAAHTFIKKEHSKLKEVIEDQKRLNIAQKESERLKGDIEEAVRAISLEEKLGNQENQVEATNAIYECEKHCQERINKLRKNYSELDIEKKILERKKENLETRNIELYSETTKIRGRIIEIEGEISNYLKQCQELYDSQIEKIQQVHNAIKAAHAKNQ